MKDKNIDYKKLRDSREDKNLTQKEMAAKLNIEQAAYSRIENGKRGVRVEQLAVIAKMLGKSMNELLIENKTNPNLSSLEVTNNENEFLLSMLSLISTTAEDELFSLIHRYDNNYPLNQLSYEEYLNDPHSNPNCAVSQIKQDIEDYKNDITYPIYDEWSEEGIELFIGKDDEWLLNYVKKEENYDLVYVLLDHPSYQTIENSMLGFKDMLKENPIIHKLFQYGLLEKSWFSFLWDRYLEEMKSTPTGDGFWPSHIGNFWPVKNDDGKIDFSAARTIDLVETAKRREEREHIREKMRSILKDKK